MSAKTPEGEDYASRRTCARDRAQEEETLNASPTDREIFPEINLNTGDASLEDIANYSRNEPISNRSILDGIVMDWATKSPISPVPQRLEKLESIGIIEKYTDADDLYNIMNLIQRVRKGLVDDKGEDITEISDAETAGRVFRAIRRYTGLHMKDIFDSDWLDLNQEGQSSGYDQIMNIFPYANMRFSIDMPDGLDQDRNLTTFTLGDMTAFADPKNMFFYQNGFLLYASTFHIKNKEETNDIFIFSDEKAIHETSFHDFCAKFYDALKDQGNDYNIQHRNFSPMMAHLRSFYSDNDIGAVERKLKDSINIESAGLDSVLERINTSQIICDSLEEFSRMHPERLITDKAFENFVREKSLEAHRKAERGQTPLHKL